MKPKKNLIDKTNTEEVVISALKNPKFTYRTVRGITKETKVPEKIVIQVLNTNPKVRRSLARSIDGQELYAEKKRVSGFVDAWNVFRAMSSAKIGG